MLSRIQCLQIALALAFVSQSVPDAYAHGGTYAGPPTPPPVIPPKGGTYSGPKDGLLGPGSPGRGPQSGDPSLPGGPKATPGASGYRSGDGPKSGNPANPSSPQIFSGAYGIDEDLSNWEIWWAYQAPEILNLRSKIWDGGPVSGGGDSKSTLKPSPEYVRERVVPELIRFLHEENHPDATTAALVALARIGNDPRIASELAHYLSDPNQEVAETAVFCLGLLGEKRSLPTLMGIASDRSSFRSFIGKESIPWRTRVFAIYGIAALAQQCESEEDRDTVLRFLKTLSRTSNNDFEIARIAALSMVPDPELRSLDDLRRMFDDEALPVQVRAQIPSALVRILRQADRPSIKAPIRDRLLFVAEQQSQHSWLRSASIQALPELVDSESEAKVVSKLTDIALGSRSGIEKQFALIGLGRIGGESAKQTLLKIYSKNNQLRSWVALALAIADRTGKQSDRNIREFFVSQWSEQKNASTLGAFAIGFGLTQNSNATQMLVEKMRETSQDELKGYCALSLGMLDAREQVSELETLIESNVRRPELQKQIAISLGLLRDHQIADKLVDQLIQAKTLAQRSAYATSLGWVGDQRSIDSLLKLMSDKSLTPTSKAFVVVALGRIVDPRPLPWNAQFLKDFHYPSAAVTQIDRANFTGIFDIL